MADLRLRFCLINGDHIEAAKLIGQLIDMIVSFGNALKLTLLADVDKIFGLAAGILRTGLDLDEDKALAIHSYDIDLADASIMESALDDLIAEARNIVAGIVLAVGAGVRALRRCL